MVGEIGWLSVLVFPDRSSTILPVVTGTSMVAYISLDFPRPSGSRGDFVYLQIHVVFLNPSFVTHRT